MQAILPALEGDTGAIHFREAEGVVGLDAEHLFDAATVFLGVRLGTDDQGVQLCRRARIQAFFLEDVVEAAEVAGMACATVVP